MGQVRDWFKSYQGFGKEGLLRKRQNQSYSGQFKMDAIELYQTTELTYREVANHLGINTPSLVANWMRIFRTVKESMDSQQRKDVYRFYLRKKKRRKQRKKHLKNAIASRN